MGLPLSVHALLALQTLYECILDLRKEGQGGNIWAIWAIGHLLDGERSIGPGPICHKLMSTAVAVDTLWRECTQLGSSTSVHAVQIWDGVFGIGDPVFPDVFNHFPG